MGQEGRGAAAEVLAGGQVQRGEAVLRASGGRRDGAGSAGEWGVKRFCDKIGSAVTAISRPQAAARATLQVPHPHPPTHTHSHSKQKRTASLASTSAPASSNSGMLSTQSLGQMLALWSAVRRSSVSMIATSSSRRFAPRAARIKLVMASGLPVTAATCRALQPLSSCTQMFAPASRRIWRLPVAPEPEARCSGMHREAPALASMSAPARMSSATHADSSAAAARCSGVQPRPSRASTAAESTPRRISRTSGRPKQAAWCNAVRRSSCAGDGEGAGGREGGERGGGAKRGE